MGALKGVRSIERGWPEWKSTTNKNKKNVQTSTTDDEFSSIKILKEFKEEKYINKFLEEYYSVSLLHYKLKIVNGYVVSSFLIFFLYFFVLVLQNINSYSTVSLSNYYYPCIC